MGKLLVQTVSKLKKLFGCHTYHIEQAFVALVLITTALISRKGWIERIGVVAVFFTFGHASVADRLHEAEAEKAKHNEHSVRCYYKLTRYYYAKEICRLIYFIFLGARSAIVGVVLFALYGPRRKLWRKYHPGKSRE